MKISLESMRRLTISVTDEVAARAQATGNASAGFTRAGERMMGAEQYLDAGRQNMAAAGITVTDEGVARAGAALDAAQARLSPADRAALRRGPQAYKEHLAAGQRGAAPEAA